MRNPDRHDQPAEGGREIVERALQKQEEAEKKSKKPAPTSNRDKQSDKPREK